jgi:hypothetical protein
LRGERERGDIEGREGGVRDRELESESERGKEMERKRGRDGGMEGGR